MTKRELGWAVAVAAVVVAVLAAGHFLLPLAGATWSVSRWLHYGWLAVAGLAGAAGVAVFLWPRAQRRRRDVERQRAQHRVICVIGVVVLTVGLVAFGEVRRDSVTRTCLEKAREDLRAIRSGLDAYAAAHGGAEPEKLADLVPEYLAAEHLRYVQRCGPTATPPSPDEEPSYVLLPKPPVAADAKEKRQQTPFRVVQRPDEGWAPLVTALDRQGRIGILSDDDARRLLLSVKPAGGSSNP